MNLTAQYDVKKKIDLFELLATKAFEKLSKDRKFRKLKLDHTNVAIAANTLADIAEPDKELKEIILHYPKTKRSLMVKEVIVDGIKVHLVPRDFETSKDLGEMVPVIGVWKARQMYAHSFSQLLAQVGIKY